MLNRVREREKEARKQEHQKQLSIISSSSVCTPHPQTQCALWNGVLCVVCATQCLSFLSNWKWLTQMTHTQSAPVFRLIRQLICLSACLPVSVYVGEDVGEDAAAANEVLCWINHWALSAWLHCWPTLTVGRKRGEERKRRALTWDQLEHNWKS